MKKSKFTEAQIVFALRQAESGVKIEEVVMENLKQKYKVCANTIRLDNGPEFIGKDLDRWASFNNVTLDFSRRGKPTDNSFCESFNGTFRDECLNTNWFMSHRKR